jgi:hypothetical protein
MAVFWREWCEMVSLLSHWHFVDERISGIHAFGGGGSILSPCRVGDPSECSGVQFYVSGRAVEVHHERIATYRD